MLYIIQSSIRSTRCDLLYARYVRITYTLDTFVMFVSSLCSYLRYVRDHSRSITLIYPLLDTSMCYFVSFTLLVDYHSDIVETNNTYFEIFESIKFDIIFRRSPIISSSTHELAVLQEYSIHFTVLNIYFIRFVYTYLSFWSKSSKITPFRPKVIGSSLQLTILHNPVPTETL